MQDLPVILAVLVSAAAIIAVLFWRIKPQAAPATDALNKRILEEAKKADSPQAKLDANEATLRDTLTAAATANATAEAANTRASLAETHANQAKSYLEVLQGKYNEAQPSIITAIEQKKAAEDARADVIQRLADLTMHDAAMQSKLNLMSERAIKAEKDAASAKAEADSADKRIEQADARLNEATAKFDALHIDFSENKSLLAEVTAHHEAAEDAKNDLEHRLASLTANYDLLMIEHKSAVAQAATAQNEAANTHTRNGEFLAAYETKVQELAEVNGKLGEALAKQKADDAVSDQFKVIGQTALKEVLEAAKREVGELAASFQRTSGAELEKHAGQVARTLEPLQVKLEAYDKAIKSMEDASHKSYGGLMQQITELKDAELSLNKQAKALTTALSSSPKVKGSYGELMLKQLVEFVGMHERCHFDTQAAHDTEDGRKIPDMVVSLPNGQKVLVDSKAVMDACVEAHQSDDDVQRAILLKKHCDNVRSRVVDLASKNYFAGQRDTVEAVVLFLPAENLYATAVENDPGLTEYAMRQNIIVCGPNSLMMLLKVANQLWQRASIEEEALKIKDCGDNIYKSACDFIDKFAQIGTKIRQLEGDYNDAAGTLDSRLIPRGREMGRFSAVANHREIKEIPHLKEDIREFRSVEAKSLLASTSKLPNLMIGDETAELEFSAGDK